LTSPPATIYTQYTVIGSSIPPVLFNLLCRKESIPTDHPIIRWTVHPQSGPILTALLSNVYTVLILDLFIHNAAFFDSTCSVSLKGKVLPYSLPNVGLGADPGVQVTINHNPGGRLPLLSATSASYLRKYSPDGATPN